MLITVGDWVIRISSLFGLFFSLLRLTPVIISNSNYTRNRKKVGPWLKTIRRKWRFAGKKRKAEGFTAGDGFHCLVQEGFENANIESDQKINDL